MELLSTFYLNNVIFYDEVGPFKIQGYHVYFLFAEYFEIYFST